MDKFKKISLYFMFTTLIIMVIFEATLFIFYYLGSSAINHQDFAQAEVYLRKVAILPYLPSSFHAQLAYTYEQQGKLKKAIKSYEKALAKNPKKVHLHNHLSQLYYCQYNLDKAIYHLKKYQKLKPTKYSNYNLAILYYEQDNLNEALYFLKQAIKYDSKDSHLLDDWRLIQKERLAEKNMAIKKSEHFIIKYHQQVDEQIAVKVINYLEKAYQEIDSIFPEASGGITVVKIFDDYTFEDITNQSTSQVVATTINNKLILRSPRFLPIFRNLREIIAHEYIHLVLHRISLGRIPTWLNEGIAEFFSQNEVPEFKEKLLKEALVSQELIPLRKLQTSWENLRGKNLTLAYTQSYYFVEYLVKSYGWPKIQDFIWQISWQEDLKQASETVFGKNIEEIEKDFYNFLKSHL